MTQETATTTTAASQKRSAMVGGTERAAAHGPHTELNDGAAINMEFITSKLRLGPPARTIAIAMIHEASVGREAPTQPVGEQRVEKAEPRIALGDVARSEQSRAF